MVVMIFSVNGAELTLKRVQRAVADLPRFKKDLGRKVGLQAATDMREVLKGKQNPDNFGSGRLMATIGNFDRRFLKPTHPRAHEVSESDAVLEVDVGVTAIEIEVGSNLEYAALINDGFTFVGNRIIPIETRGGTIFRVVQAFEFEGYRFIEEGLAITQAKLPKTAAPVIAKHLGIING